METENRPGNLQDAAVPEQPDEVKSRPAKEKIDLKKLVIYSEIMSPKFKE